MPQSPQNLPAVTVGSTSPKPLQIDKQGGLLRSGLHGDNYNQAYNGNLFRGANPTPVTLSAALATTYVGLCLSNPVGSTKNLAVRNVGAVTIIAPATFLALGLIVGWIAGGVTAHTTPLTPAPSLINGVGVPLAKLDSAATLVGTPAWARWLNASLATGGQVNFNADIQGGIIIPPGGYVAIGANAAGPAAGFLGSIEWEEVAL